MSLHPLFTAANDNPKNKNASLVWQVKGGHNLHRIGGNCGILHYQSSAESRPLRVAFDVGALFGDPAKPEDPALVDCDIILPDLSTMLKKRDAIDAPPEVLDAIFLTHNHVDHLGAIPYLIILGYELPPLYATPYTAKRLEQELSNQNIPPALWPDIKLIAPGQPISLHDVTITAFSVSHSTPQSVGFYIDTPAGTIVNTGDFKLDPSVTWGPGFNEEQFKRIVKKGVDVLLLDSTGADRAGAPVQEKDLRDALHALMQQHPKKRFVVTVMGGFEENMASCAKVAAETGRTLFVAGAAHEQSLDALARTGLSLQDYVGYDLDLRILTKGREAFNLAGMKPEEAMVILTGALGHQHAELTKAARGQSQKIKLDRQNDIILFCAPSIPGQEAGREKLIAHLKEQGFIVLTHKDIPALYPRAHAGQEEMLRLALLANPKVIVPQHGSDQLRAKAAELCANHTKAQVLEVKNAQAIRITQHEIAHVLSDDRVEQDQRQHWIGLKTRQGRNWKNRDYFVIHAPQDDALLHAKEKERHQGKAMPKAYTLYKRR